MSAYKVVSGGERGRRSPVTERALGRRTLSRRLAELYRAIEWDYARLWLGVFATVFVLVYVAKVRGR